MAEASALVTGRRSIFTPHAAQCIAERALDVSDAPPHIQQHQAALLSKLTTMYSIDGHHEEDPKSLPSTPNGKDTARVPTPPCVPSPLDLAPEEQWRDDRDGGVAHGAAEALPLPFPGAHAHDGRGAACNEASQAPLPMTAPSTTVPQVSTRPRKWRPRQRRVMVTTAGVPQGKLATPGTSSLSSCVLPFGNVFPVLEDGSSGPLHSLQPSLSISPLTIVSVEPDRFGMNGNGTSIGALMESNVSSTMASGPLGKAGHPCEAHESEDDGHTLRVHPDNTHSGQAPTAVSIDGGTPHEGELDNVTVSPMLSRPHSAGSLLSGGGVAGGSGSNYAGTGDRQRAAPPHDDGEDREHTPSSQASELLRKLAAARHSPWVRFRTFQVPAVARVVNTPPHAVLGCIRSEPLPERPRGVRAKYAALCAQNCECASCGAALPIEWFAWRRGGIPSLSSAVYCYETGLYHCRQCHRGDHAVILAYALQWGDTTPRPVCTAVHRFWQQQRTAPILCVSALAPWLYDRVPLLRAAHTLRGQINEMRDVGVQCRSFRLLFYGEDFAVSRRPSSPPPHCTDTYVQEEWRYYVEDTELWSLQDLVSLLEVNWVVAAHTTEVDRRRRPDASARMASNGGSSGGADVLSLAEPQGSNPVEALSRCHKEMWFGVLVLEALQSLRRRFSSHLLGQCALCTRHAADVCRKCCPESTACLFAEAWLSDEERTSGTQQEDPHRDRDDTFHDDDSTSFLQKLPSPVVEHLVWAYDVLHVRRCAECHALSHRHCPSVGRPPSPLSGAPCCGCGVLLPEAVPAKG